jgi:NitT/TauT family transport system substrate-binding protein
MSASRRHRARASLGAFAGLAAVVASLSAGSAAARQAQSLTPVDIAAIAVEPAAQAFYAKDMGFFERHGIDARITILAPTLSVPAVVSGQIQFAGNTTGGLAGLKAKGFPLKLVAAGALYVPDAPTSALVAAPRKRITTPKGLVGRRVAVDFQTSLAHLALLRWMKRGGVAADQIKLSTMAFSRMLSPLLNGQVAAAVLPEPYVAQTTSRGARRVFPILNTVCTKDCLITVWIARKDVDANLAARFRNAMQNAAAWANKLENQRRSGEILAKYTELDRALIARSTRTKFAKRLRPAQAQPVIDLSIEFGLVPKTFTAQDLVK